MSFISIARRHRPTWVVWENVPGVLSSGGGRDFGAFVGALSQCGYEYAWRVLDAQYFGVPQRRRRVFVVGSTRAGGAARVLFDGTVVCGDFAESRSPGQDAAGLASGAARNGGGEGLKLARESGPGYWVEDSISGTIAAHVAKDGATPALIAVGSSIKRGWVSERTAHTLATQCCEATEDGTGRGSPLVGEATLRAPSVAGTLGGSLTSGGFRTTDPDTTGAFVAQQGGVRRLTPRECERLQGFPDDWTAITFRGKPARDSPRYKAIGNSMAVPVMRWIGDRIAAITGAAASREHEAGDDP